MGDELDDLPVARPKRVDYSSFDQEDIENWFTYHAPTAENLVQYAELRDVAKRFAETINRLVPAGSDKTVAIRKVREAVMTANAGVACSAGWTR